MSYGYYQPQQQQNWSQTQRSEVLNKVVNGLILAAAVVLAALFGGLPGWVFFVALGVEFIAVIGYMFARSEPTIEKLYYTFVVASSVVLSYTIGYTIVGIAGGALLVFYALGLTTSIVAGIFYYTSRNKPNTLYLRKYLFVALIGLFLVIIAGIFIPFSSGFNLLISIAGAVLFSLYLYYDLGRLENEQYSSPSRMAFQIFWDILLIFKFILRTLIHLND